MKDQDNNKQNNNKVRLRKVNEKIPRESRVEPQQPAEPAARIEEFLPHLVGLNPTLVAAAGGGLLLVKRASAEDIAAVLAPRMMAIGLLARFITPKPLGSSSSSSSSAAASNASRVVPSPPALPTSWPPTFVYETQTENTSPLNIFAATPAQTPEEERPKTKRVYWDPMQDITSTLWADDLITADLPTAEELFPDIREAFSAVVIPLKAFKADKDRLDRPKMLLDPQRSQAIGM